MGGFGSGRTLWLGNHLVRCYAIQFTLGVLLFLLFKSILTVILMPLSVKNYFFMSRTSLMVTLLRMFHTRNTILIFL